jgi:hypothetical protein
MISRRIRPKPIFRLGKYRQGVAAFIANRTRIPYGTCLDIVEWNWPTLAEAYHEGASFQDAGRRILRTAGTVPTPRHGPVADRRPRRQRGAAEPPEGPSSGHVSLKLYLERRAKVE